MLVTQSRKDVVPTNIIDDITYQNVENNPRQIFNLMKKKSDKKPLLQSSFQKKKIDCGFQNKTLFKNPHPSM